MREKREDEEMQTDDTPVFDAAYFDDGYGVPELIPMICEWCQEKMAAVNFNGYKLCQSCVKNELRR
ncbi:MAG TPA: hypothetical protein ENN84_11840 [Candidatus Marinimicrobia bacterium]|nr:hypothetical protein [Candidatus Neomarinimicrobiota bacterium]